MGLLLQEENKGMRGAVRVMRYRYGFADTQSATAHEFDFPSLDAGTVIRSIHVRNTAFDSGSSDALEIGTSADPNRFVSSVSTQAARNTSLVGGVDPSPFQLTADTVIRVTATPAGSDATAGEADVTVTYELCNNE